MTDLATRAYVYGFPLVFNVEHIRQAVDAGFGRNPAAPFNHFSHSRSLAGPAEKFVSINNDTTYSFAQIDLSAGPLRLEVPDTQGRYYVLQFVSAWTDNFAYIGKRATGTAQASFLLVPPGWSGASPADVRVIHFPTNVGSIVGRWAVSDAADLPTVHALQDGLRLTPVEGSRPPAGLSATGLGTDDPELSFWEQYRVHSQAFPPAPRDRQLQESFGPLGLLGSAPVNKLPDGTQDALHAGYAAGAELLKRHLRDSLGLRNGWQDSTHVFDYNLDYFEVGAIDAPQWRLTDPDQRLLFRALGALGGLWGNHAYEAAYFPVYRDWRNDQLTGEHEYTVTFGPPPPNQGFWSLKMYGISELLLVDNVAGRYSVGDRTAGLIRDEDGGLTIHVSAREPEDPKQRANWLPAPKGPFRPILRIYLPEQSVLDGNYVLPPFVRTE